MSVSDGTGGAADRGGSGRTRNPSRAGGAGRADRAELAALVELRVLPGIGDARLRRLIGRYGSARAALEAPAAALGEQAAEARGVEPVRTRVARSLDTIRRLGIEVIVETDPRYPERLSHLHDPPYVLFTRGRLELLDRPAVAIVGSRRHTRYGAGATRMLADGLARTGVVVVSGLAHGIDGHAHRAALGGGTIAVLACGTDVVFPHEHEKLQERIAREGLLVGEFPPGEPPLPFNFPRRNRLIAALARGVVVVEAGAKSGALITVEHAMDLGREIFAVPGPIDRDTSVGTNALLRDGARLVTDAGDVLEELGLAGPDVIAETRAEAARRGAADGDSPPAGLADGAQRLWKALDRDPIHVDVLADRCDLAPAVALGTLLELELDGHARQLPGTRFARSR